MKRVIMQRSLFVGLIIAALFAGRDWEANRIQATCEADNGHTVLNGTEYLCLSQRQIEIMKSHSQRGA
jgi:hypothetical protein